jgi:ribosomal 50S subunit-recycling heat shock protein
MRLDKFLKLSALFKTRSSAEKAIDTGNILLNDVKTKPAATVKTGDELTITTPLKKSRYKVVNIFEKNVTKKEAKEMTALIGEEKFEL